MPIGHERDRAPGLGLPAVAKLLQLREDGLRRKDGKVAHELDEMLESRLPVLLERLHRKKSLARGLEECLEARRFARGRGAMRIGSLPSGLPPMMRPPRPPQTEME